MGNTFKRPDIGVKPKPKPDEPDEPKPDEPEPEKTPEKGGDNILSIFIPDFAQMLRNTISFILEQFIPLLDLAYTSALNMTEKIFGIVFNDEVKDRVNFTMSVVSIILIFFVGKSSISLFRYSAGIL